MSEQRFRLAEGGRIDRERPLRFTFNGAELTGYAGDTLASALLANGVRLVGRSFKYHRPRGIFAEGAEEPNALVQLGQGASGEPNARATQVELFEGLIAKSQNCWPNVDFDIGAVNNALSFLLPAGFYYKTFMWPKKWWMKYERFIRSAAGLGRAPTGPDPDIYDKRFAHCDVLVIGGGAAGLAAARAAARSGARVILADERPEPGGRLTATRTVIGEAPAGEWIDKVVGELDDAPDALRLQRTTALGYYDHNFVTLLERCSDHLPLAGRSGDRIRQRLWKVRAKQVVLATGAHERPLVFRNNDKPGVMLAGAAQAYSNRYAVRPGAGAAVVFTNNDSGWESAIDLADIAGMRVTLVDMRSELSNPRRTVLRRHGIELLAGHAITDVHGRKAVKGVSVAALDGAGGGYSGRHRKIRCDLVCSSGGWNPAVHLFSQSGGKLGFDEERGIFLPFESKQPQDCVGACKGTFELGAAIAEGHEAGEAAAAACGFEKRGAPADLPEIEASEETPIRLLWATPSGSPRRPRSKHFVDLQNDVTVADVKLAAREGYRSVEHLKRYTTTGMGTDQGKTSNVNALALLSQALDSDIALTGTTTFRPPFVPATFGALAGREVGSLSDPIRTTPMHEWHVEKGAVFEDVGQWKRPRYYPQAEESMKEAVDRECLAVRNAVGILDATTLGKIDIQGRDAAEFLERIYTNHWKKLGVGRGRYGLMCTEDGMVFDDGVTLRLGERHFLMHTTTSNAARVLAWLEEWLQTEWPELQVHCSSLTEQLATASISGPLARSLLADIAPDIDLDAKAFPFMHWREGEVAGIPARIARISFTGESSFEISTPAGFGLSLWTALIQNGRKYGLTPYGTEAMHVLRAERGFIIVGQETDGTVTPVDIGMESMVSKSKDFIGKRSLSRSNSEREDRKQLVGLLTESPTEVLPEGAQIVEREGPLPMSMIGHVSSSYYSANLGHSIALALVRSGRSRHGESVVVPLERRNISVRITAPEFLDPEGSRARS
ncbi:MAG: sarcosine oxidase subunit alpha family protein [Ectothiorhodospiraceae bacterium AqS1]|nr:sarcosine oxidase subunit alpha family protein [Ectothiorhodospiraceae bacterium AqS1]